MPQKLFIDGFFQTMLKSGKLTWGLSLPELFFLLFPFPMGEATKSSWMNLGAVISSDITYNQIRSNESSYYLMDSL